MAGMRSREEDSVAPSTGSELELGDPCIKDREDTERESPSQPLVNVSQDMCLILTGAKPQVCPALSPSKCLADVISSEEYSQAPTSGTQIAHSQQPSHELLMSLGIKVRDFAYENTLPAIVPVPRVPRQVQPAPRALKRSQRDWDDKEDTLDSLSLEQSPSERTGLKKLRSLERKPTEPLQEPVVQHTRTLERLMVERVFSVFKPPSRRGLPTTPCTQLSVSSPASRLTPSLSHLASQESEFVQTPPGVPFVVHVDDTSMIPTSQHSPESQPPCLHPVLHAKFTSDSRSSPSCSPAPSPPERASPAPLLAFLELPFQIKGSGTDTRVRKRRSPGGAGATPPSRYQLRQRPVPSPLTSALSRCSHHAGSTSKSLPRRTRRLR